MQKRVFHYVFALVVLAGALAFLFFSQSGVKIVGLEPLGGGFGVRGGFGGGFGVSP